MSPEETEALTTILFTGYDREKPPGIDQVWHAALADVPFELGRAAAIRLIQTSTFLPKVAELRQCAAGIHRERHRIEREAEEQFAIEQYAAQAGPLKDRRAEIQAFVGQVRTVLPDTGREVIRPREVAWEQEHRAHQRALTAEPNPAYDASMQPIPEWNASSKQPAGAWWEDDAARERHAKTLLAEAGRLRPKT